MAERAWFRYSAGLLLTTNLCGGFSYGVYILYLYETIEKFNCLDCLTFSFNFPLIRPDFNHFSNLKTEFDDSEHFFESLWEIHFCGRCIQEKFLSLMQWIFAFVQNRNIFRGVWCGVGGKYHWVGVNIFNLFGKWLQWT